MYDHDRKIKELESDNWYLETQLERYRQEERERDERRQRQREKERKERERLAREALCHADTWEEAFDNNAIRYAEEASWCDEELGETFFATQVKVNARAREIYRAEMKKAEAEIKKVEAEAKARIETLQLRACKSTADALRTEFNEDAQDVIECLEKNDPQAYVWW